MLTGDLKISTREKKTRKVQTRAMMMKIVKVPIRIKKAKAFRKIEKSVKPIMMNWKVHI